MYLIRRIFKRSEGYITVAAAANEEEAIRIAIEAANFGNAEYYIFRQVGDKYPYKKEGLWIADKEGVSRPAWWIRKA